MKKFQATGYSGPGQLIIDLHDRAVRLGYHNSARQCENTLYSAPLSGEELAELVEYLSSPTATGTELVFAKGSDGSQQVNCLREKSGELCFKFSSLRPPTGYDLVEAVTLSRRILESLVRHLEDVTDQLKRKGPDGPRFGM